MVCVHTSFFYFCVSRGNTLHVDIQKVVGTIPTAYNQCVDLFKIRYIVFHHHRVACDTGGDKLLSSRSHADAWF